MARALLKVTKGGLGYLRPPDIEARIDAALAQTRDEQIRQARITNQDDPDYMCSECLVHLVREARITGDKGMLDRLLPPLLARCVRRLKMTFPSSIANAQNVREELLQSFCMLVVHAGTDQDATALDIFECRFNKGFIYLRYKYLRSEKGRAAKFRDLNDARDGEGRPLDPESLLTRLSRAARTPANQEDFVYVADVMKQIQELPEAQRKAILLCGVQGYQPASEDPDEITAATICGISGTAARKNLRKAIEKLTIRKER